MRELGLVGTLEWAGRRAGRMTANQAVTLWWRLKGSRESGDAALLRQVDGAWASMPALLDHLAERPAASFLLPEVGQAGAADFARRYPEAVRRTIVAADEAASLRFELLGRRMEYPGRIDWRRAPGTDWVWPAWHVSAMDELVWGGKRPVDLKPLWEINRHQHLVTMGMAFWLSGEERYADAAAEQLLSWIEQNPPELGINWFSALEVAIRVISWTVAFQCLRTWRPFRQWAGPALIKSLHRQAAFLRDHLTTYEPVPNNHLIGEAAALAVVGAAFPEFHQAADWRQSGLTLLHEQVAAQTHPDGVNKEQATGYQRFVLEFLLPVVAMGRRGLLDASALEPAVLTMLEYVDGTITPDGRVPMWGDADDGRVLGLALAGDFWDFRPMLATGAALFSRGDFKAAAGEFGEESYLLLGEDGLAAWQALPAAPSRRGSSAFAEGGVYVLRRGDDMACMRCGPFGLGGDGRCAHAHCDLLSPQVWLSGQPFLVDSGTYTYHGPERNAFRATAAHSTLVLDGREQARPAGEFAWEAAPAATLVAYDEGSVTAELALAAGLRHRRRLALVGPGQCAVTDRLFGEGRHECIWRFHLAPGLQAEPRGRNLVVSSPDAVVATVAVPAAVTAKREHGWHSAAYGQPRRNGYHRRTLARRSAARGDRV